MKHIIKTSIEGKSLSRENAVAFFFSFRFSQCLPSDNEHIQSGFMNFLEQAMFGFGLEANSKYKRNSRAAFLAVINNAGSIEKIFDEVVSKEELDFGGNSCMQPHTSSSLEITDTPITPQVFQQYLKLFKDLIKIGARDVKSLSGMFRKQITILTNANVHLCNNALFEFFTNYDGKNYIYYEVIKRTYVSRSLCIVAEIFCGCIHSIFRLRW